jgi:four helix bundle protein
MSDFRKLDVWRKPHALALNSHRAITRIRGALYSSERHQAFRAAMSIPTNIVESRGQKSVKDQCRFLNYAINSSNELEYHLLAGKHLGLVSKTDFASLQDQIIEVRKMLYGLLKYLRGLDDE